MKIIKYFLFIFLLIFPFNCFASDRTFERDKDNLKVPSDIAVNDENINDILKTPCVDESEKIYDFAHVLSDDEEKKIYKDIKAYIDNSGYDAVIILTDDLKGFSIADYTYHFHDYNFFSVEGIIFTIYINNDNPEIFMSNTGAAGTDSEIFEIYNDKRLESMLKYEFEHYIVDKNYYDACTNFIKIVDGFYNKAHGDYKVDSSGNIVKDIPWIESIVVSFAVTFIVVVLLISRFSNKFNKSNDSLKNCLNYDTMIVKCESDNVIQKK